MRIEFHDVKVTNNIKLNAPDELFSGTETDGDSDWCVSFKIDPLMVMHLSDPSKFSPEDRQQFTENLMSKVVPLCFEFSARVMEDYKIKYGLTDEDMQRMRDMAAKFLDNLNIGL